jgi:hypothetical protein
MIICIYFPPFSGENFSQKTYNLNVEGKAASLNLTYVIQSSGVFLQSAKARSNDDT